MQEQNTRQVLEKHDQDKNEDEFGNGRDKNNETDEGNEKIEKID